MKREKPYYSLKTKKQAVQMVATGLLSEDQACQKYKISRTLLHQWQRCGSPPGHDKFFVQPLLNSDPMAGPPWLRKNYLTKRKSNNSSNDSKMLSSSSNMKS